MRFHIVKRDHCPLWKKLCLYLLAVGAALAVGGLLLLAMGVDPVAYYSRMFTMGMVGNKIAYKTFENYLKVFVPLALTSVALSLAFKMQAVPSLNASLEWTLFMFTSTIILAARICICLRPFTIARLLECWRPAGGCTA